MRKETGAGFAELVGAFVTVFPDTDDRIPGFEQARIGPDGIGRLVGFEPGRTLQAIVEYFVSPAGPRLERRAVDARGLRRVRLWPETSVFWFDERTDCWRRGRITASEQEGVAPANELYRVRFPNDDEGTIAGPSLYVRWAHPIEDPVEYLAARVTDTPYFFEGRRRIVSCVAEQRAAFGGLTGLASASIDLLEHQFAILRRVLADPVQRYLLADEVGLGKTIEACAVVRQHLVDDPTSARVLVVVPDHLVQQWMGELWLRFGVSESDARVRVIGESSVATGALDAPGPTLLIVDEAHRSAAGAFARTDTGSAALYSALKALADAAPRVLLLSGTPVLRQEDGFLAMLHLLDPKAYPLQDRDGFRERIRNRSAVADAVAQLTDDAGAMFVEDAIAQLERAFEDDRQLLALTRKVAAAADRDESDPERIAAIRKLRVHVTDTYKLHRRLLRTRRDDPSVKPLLAVRRGLEKLPCDDPARRIAWDLIEEWRCALPLDALGKASTRATAVFADMVEAAFSHPVVLAISIRSRREALSATGRGIDTGVQSMFPEEQRWCDRALIALKAALRSEPRATALAAWLTGAKTKAIVFVDSPEVARGVAQRLRDLLGSEKVLEVGLPKAEADVLPGTVERFVEDAAVQVLVADRRAEEGLNLQRARGAVLVHYDMPFAPTRIEQRNGRVDRLDANGIPRFLTFEGASTYEDEWLMLLEQRVQVFHRTVAPLQYLLADSCQHMRDHLVSQGSHVFAEESARLAARGGIEDELRLIRNQEALDSTGLDPEEDTGAFERMCQVDEAASEQDGREVEAWLCGRLNFQRTGIRDGEREPDFHYTYRLGGRVLLPLHTVVTMFGQSLDRENSDSRALRFGRFTYDREEVVGENGVRLLRPGNPFLDSLEELVRCDDRGAAFAFWRLEPTLSKDETYLFFRFEFVLEADVEPARTMVRDANGALEALRHLADAAFPPLSRTVWCDVDGKRVTSQAILARLELPYETPRDTNLRPDRWPRADALCPVHDWKGLCGNIRAAALAALWDEPILRLRDAAVRRFEEKAAAHRAQWESRIGRIPVGPARTAEEHAANYGATLDVRMLRGVREPRVRVDSVGTVYLSGTSLRDP